MVQYWIVKAEPNDWSIDLHSEKRIESWTGVRNYEARNNLRKMSLGDEVLFYRSVTEPGFVGRLIVAGTSFPDPTDPTKKFDAIDLEYASHLEAPVPLHQIKASSKLANLMMLKRGRLSVVPIQKHEFSEILDISKRNRNSIRGA